jgi:hypothetical protein
VRKGGQRRPIDEVMVADRPDKDAVRRGWIADVVARRHEARPTEPLYLTLPGRAGHEIRMLIEAGVLRTAETGAIHQDDLGLVVAVEKDSDAVLALKQDFPGLRVLRRPVLDLMASDNSFSLGPADERYLCRSTVMNLDFNSKPKIVMRDGQLVIRELVVIEKLAIHHGESEHINWTLFLTFNAMADLSQDAIGAMLHFLKANMDIEETFADHCRSKLNRKIQAAIEVQDAALALTHEDVQQLLMAYIPKKIAHMTHTKWRILTRRNYCYGGHDDSAYMVTFAMDFVWDTRGSIDVYKESVKMVLENAVKIGPDGSEVALILTD